MPLSLPLLVVGALHLVYGAIVTTLWIIGAPTPPPAVGSVIAAFIVSACVLATRRHCDCREDIAGLVKACEALTGRVQATEERLSAARQVYVVPAPEPAEHQVVGVDPESIGALRRINDRVRGNRDGS